MSDILSQSEIDALLNKFGSGELDIAQTSEPEVSVREYDFRTANRFHKEQIRTLNIIYDTFARLFASYLSGTLRVMTTSEVVSVEELKYHEFVNGLPSPVVLAILKHPPLAGPILFELSPDISYAMISRLLGGVPQQKGDARVFTEIELVLIERILRQFLTLFVESWEKIVSVQVSLDRIETSPQFAQIVATNETVAIITISVKIGTIEGLVNICLPHLAIEPISKLLTTKVLYQSSETSRKMVNAKEDISGKIMNTQLDLTAIFNYTPLSVKDIMGLQVGDVLQLDHTLSEPLNLMLGHLPKFYADLGVKEGRYALKVKEIIRRDDNE